MLIFWGYCWSADTNADLLIWVFATSKFLTKATVPSSPNLELTLFWRNWKIKRDNIENNFVQLIDN